MFQRRAHRSAPRTRTLAVGGALAALAVVGGGTVVAVSAPSAVTAGDIQLVQNAAPQEMELGAPVDLDLEPVVAKAAGGTIPAGTSIKVTGLPDGLVQNGWVISGTPSRAGEYNVLITVSNSGVTKSEKVAITVVDESGAATTADGDNSGATTTATDDETTDSETAEGATADGETTEGEAAEGDSTETATGAEEATGTEGTTTTTTSPTTAATTTSRPEPTLSAVPGAAAKADEAGTGTEAGTETEAGTGTEDGTDAGTTPDLCAIGEDGEMDTASLASGLAPLLAGDGGQAQGGFAMVLVNAIASMLPALLGESGSAGDVGSVGQILCTLSPALTGSGADGATEGDDTTTGDDATTATSGTDATTGATGDATTAGTATGAAGQVAALAGLTGAPAALLGMLGTGTGSIGG